MYVAPSTNLDGENSLYCKLYRFTPEGKDLVSTGAFRYFSIELYRKYKRAIGEKYKVFKNVITGLALTNDPVVADLAPTFSKDEGKQLSINNNDMLLKNMVKKLSKQEFVSETEKELLTMTFSAADEDAQEEYEEAVEEIKEKPEQEEASDNPEVAELSKAVKTLQKENAELRLSQKKDAAVAFSKQFAVSDENKVGFAKADMKDVEALALTFSKEQQDAFKELFGKIQLSEAGEIGDAEAEGDETEEAQVKALAKETEEGESSVVSYSKGELELEKLTKTYMKNNPDVPYLKAYAKVLDANPHLAE